MNLAANETQIIHIFFDRVGDLSKSLTLYMLLAILRLRVHHKKMLKYAINFSKVRGENVATILNRQAHLPLPRTKILLFL